MRCRAFSSPAAHQNTSWPRPVTRVSSACALGASALHLHWRALSAARARTIHDAGLAGDGGGLEVIAFDGQTLEISYHGACGSCPSATTGTLRYIEGMLQEEVDPGIRVVSW